MFIRIALLWSITWVMRLTTPWFVTFGNEISGRDASSARRRSVPHCQEHARDSRQVEGEEGRGRTTASFVGIIIQILLLDIVFSLDSVITAVGMAEDLAVMVLAVVVRLA